MADFAEVFCYACFCYFFLSAFHNYSHHTGSPKYWRSRLCHPFLHVQFLLISYFFLSCPRYCLSIAENGFPDTFRQSLRFITIPALLLLTVRSEASIKLQNTESSVLRHPAVQKLSRPRQPRTPVSQLRLPLPDRWCRELRLHLPAERHFSGLSFCLRRGDALHTEFHFRSPWKLHHDTGNCIR